MLKKIVFLSVLTFAAAAFASDDGPFGGKPAEWRSFSFDGAVDVIPYKNLSVPLTKGMTVADLKQELMRAQYKDESAGDRSAEFEDAALNIIIYKNEDMSQFYADDDLVASIPENLKLKYDDRPFREAVRLPRYVEKQVVFTFKNGKTIDMPFQYLNVVPNFQRVKEDLSEAFKTDASKLLILSANGAPIDNIDTLKNFVGELNFKVTDEAPKSGSLLQWLNQNVTSWWNGNNNSAASGDVTGGHDFERSDVAQASGLSEEVLKAWEDDSGNW